MESTVAEGQGNGREAVAERSPRQIADHRNTKRQRGRVRATSVRVNAKSKVHQDASSRAAWHGWKVHVLTQGDLLEAKAGEQKSAEAIVVKMPSESPAERRAEGTTAKRPGSLGTGKKNPNVSSLSLEDPRHAVRTQNALMVQPS